MPVAAGRFGTCSVPAAHPARRLLLQHLGARAESPPRRRRGLPVAQPTSEKGRVRRDGGQPAAPRRPPDTFGHLLCPRVASIRRGCGSASLGEHAALPLGSSATLLSALGAACRSSECRGDGAGPRQAQHHRRWAGNPSPARTARPGQCERHQLGADLHPPHPLLVQRRFLWSGRRAVANPPPQWCPRL